MADQDISVGGPSPSSVTIDQGDYAEDTAVHSTFYTLGTLNIANESDSADVLDVSVHLAEFAAGIKLNVEENANVNLTSLSLDDRPFIPGDYPVYEFSVADGATLDMSSGFLRHVLGQDAMPNQGQIFVDLSGPGTSTLIFDSADIVYFSDDPGASATFTGISAGDQVVVPGAASATYANGMLTFQDASGGTLADFHAAGLNPEDITFENGTMTYACYLKGTHIATPGGEVQIENIKAGDRVLTASGDVATVKWLGHRTLRKQRIPTKDAIRAFPVLFKKDSIAKNRPHRDLMLSPGHHVYFDGALIPAMLLVNGRTIIQQFDMKVFEYFHIELERFDIILAEGVPAESYVDTGNRKMFQNAKAVALHPDFAPAEGRPVIEGIEVVRSGPVVEAVRKRLFQRAQALTQSVRVADPDLRIEVNGQEIRAQDPRQGEGVIRFVLPAGIGDVRIRSRSAVVRETSLSARRDLRQVGVGLVRITIEDQEGRRDIDLQSTRLGGMHAPQDVHGVAMRWTTGDAVIPAALHGVNGPAVLELHVLRTYSYWDDALQRAA